LTAAASADSGPPPTAQITVPQSQVHSHRSSVTGPQSPVLSHRSAVTGLQRSTTSTAAAGGDSRPSWRF
jgi:hypothetical protein